jgi:RHS repeat-associated protein
VLGSVFLELGGTGGSPGSASASQSASQPKCWQNITNIESTLDNLGGDIVDDVGNEFSATDMSSLKNRLSSMGYSGGLTIASYAYDAQNRRIWSWPSTLDSWGNTTGYTVNVYTPGGQKLAAYTVGPSVDNNNGQSIPYIGVGLATSDQYFGSRRLATMDQLGSVGNYFPWGEDKGGTSPQDTWNFATYWRDSVSALDYANNRYYNNAYGRFMTPDPYQASANPSAPQSWNRYSYVLGDPVNANDPTGKDCTASSFSSYVYGGDPLTIEDDASTTSNADNGSGCWLPTPEGPSGVADDGDPIYSTQNGGDGTDPSDDGSGDDGTADDGVSDDPTPAPDVGTPNAACSGAFIGAGAAIGADIGWALGGGAGTIGGGGFGTIVEPGGGTVFGAWLGFELGSTGGALAGGSAGSALGGLLGSVFCSADHKAGARQSTKPKHQKGTGRKKGSRGPSTHPKYPPRKRPLGWTGTWPPPPGVPWH